MGDDNYRQARGELERAGLLENRDFCGIDRFVLEWYPRFRDEVCLLDVHIALTTACTLRCRACNMFIPYHTERMTYDLDAIKRDIRLLMERVDYVFSVTLVGGEPLLSPDLGRIVKELAYGSYSEKIGQTLIVTNGLAPIGSETLEVLRETGAVVVISDYSNALHGENVAEKTAKLLTGHGISCHVRRDFTWKDFGFPKRPIKLSEDDAYEHMRTCDPGWRGLNDGKLFFCHIAWSAEKAGLFRLDDDDVIDLVTLPADDPSSKRKIHSYNLGNFRKGYFSFCQVCGGCGNDNKNVIAAGEQR